MTRDDHDEQQARYAITPFSFALVCIGAAGMAVGAFLPYLEATGFFSRVKENTLIQHEGWPLLVFALLALLIGYRNYNEGRRGVGAIICGALGLAVAIYIASDKTARTLYPIGLTGEANTSEGGRVGVDRDRHLRRRDRRRVDGSRRPDDAQGSRRSRRPR